jgi:hypothetical protein
LVELISQGISLKQNTGQLIIEILILFEQPYILIEIKIKSIRNCGMGGEVELGIWFRLKFSNYVKADFVHWDYRLLAFNLMGIVILGVLFGFGKDGFCCHKNIFV